MSDQLHDACYLELKPGLHDHPNYTGNYRHAPKSDYPQKNSKQGEAVSPNDKAFKISMGR